MTHSFRLADGALRGVAAEMLLLPTGLVTAAVLARVLGPANYGLFSLTATFIAWLSLTTVSLLSRAAVKFVSEADQWMPVARTVLRWRLLLGSAAMLLVMTGAPLIARLFGEPALTMYLRVFAIDLLLANVVRTYRDVLTGTGRFRAVAALSAFRWIVRMVLLAVLVELTHSVVAAIAGSVITSLSELLLAHYLQPLTLRASHEGVEPFSSSRLWSVAAPLLVFSTALQLQTKVDLFALSALGGTARDEGLYGAAQNLAVPPNLFALAFAPLLLATLGRLDRAGQHVEAQQVARSSLRVCLAMLPLAAIVAGSPGEIVRLIFGSAFSDAAPLLALLFAATVALATTTVCVSIVTASERPSRVSLLGMLLIGSALVLHLVLIPRLGARGAATATALSAGVSAIAGLATVHVTWRIEAWRTVLRAVVVAVPLYWAATVLVTTTWWTLLAKLALLSVLAVSGLLVLGEVGMDDRKRLRALWQPTTIA